MSTLMGIKKRFWSKLVMNLGGREVFSELRLMLKRQNLGLATAMND